MVIRRRPNDSQKNTVGSESTAGKKVIAVGEFQTGPAWEGRDVFAAYVEKINNTVIVGKLERGEKKKKW